MRLYVSGPMTGYPGFNALAFNHAATRLRDAGYEVVNPVDCGLPDGSSWIDYMRKDIVDLLTCSGVATLPDWHASRGARLEVHIAASLEMRVLPVPDWLVESERAA